jgi:urease accessory protein
LSAAPWHAHLQLRYERDAAGRCVGHDVHEGPLRVLKALHPEGPGICHHVIVHPPGGVVGGDTLAIDATLHEGTHAVITTPGATRFYRSAGPEASQRARITLSDGARLEWLPLEAIAHRGCRARNAARLDLAPTAQMLGWDLLALGLPASGEPFDHGWFEQHIEWPQHWLERGRIDGSDTRLLSSPLGLGGHGVVATAWFASGRPLPAALRDALLDAARTAVVAQDFKGPAGATSPMPQVVLVRALAHRIEPAFALFAAVRALWRQLAWQLDAPPPRVWRT